MTHPLSNDIFNSDADALVNPVNTVGVMGAGLARAFREKYPKNYKVYKKACDDKTLKIGECLGFFEEGKWIINFPTKIHWNNPSKLEYITSGLFDLIEMCDWLEINSVAVPMLGCGLGGLNKEEVKPLIIKAFKGAEIDLQLYE